jgi:hypothetical protein
MAKKVSKLEKEVFGTIKNDIYDIRSRYCTNVEISEQFIQDLLIITGYEVDDEGYIVDSEEDPIHPEYVTCKGRLLRRTNSGIIHTTDLTFDPYNNITIMEEMFKHYLATNHTEVSSTMIHSIKEGDPVKMDCYGYMTILYSNGATIKTGLHHKDSTKYLDAFMRLESMVNDVVMNRLKPYDDFEKAFYDKYKTMNPMIASGLKK